MPERYTPEDWIDDVDVNNLSLGAELFLRRLIQVCEHDHFRFPVTPTPENPRNLWARLYYLRVEIRCTTVAHWLAECRAAGTVVVAESTRGWYVEIAAGLRFRRREKGEPRYGPRASDAIPQATVQDELRMGPIGAVPASPTPAKPGYAGARPSVPKARPMFKATDSESCTGTTADSTAVPLVPVVESGNRVLSRDGGSGDRRSEIGDGDGRFARAVEAITSSKLGKRLGRFLGKGQMVKECEQSGALWRRVLEERAVDLEALLEQGERVAEAEFGRGRDPGLTKAKWLTKRLFPDGERRRA